MLEYTERCILMMFCINTKRGSKPNEVHPILIIIPFTYALEQYLFSVSSCAEEMYLSTFANASLHYLLSTMFY